MILSLKYEGPLKSNNCVEYSLSCYFADFLEICSRIAKIWQPERVLDISISLLFLKLGILKSFLIKNYLEMLTSSIKFLFLRISLYKSNNRYIVWMYFDKL